MRVLVTGRDGQLARALMEKARSRPELDLIAVGRKDANLVVPGELAAAIASARPDVVMNAAAYTAVDQAEDEPELAFRINADAAGEAAAAAKEVGAAIVQISTDYVFDGRSEGAIREDAPANPLGSYGRSKLAGEEQVRAANSNHVIVRTAWLYSPFGRNFVKTIMAAATEKEVLPVVDDQIGSPTSAFDLADGVLNMMQHWRHGGRTGFGQAYHLSGSGSTSWCGFATEIMAQCRALGLAAARVEPIGTDDWPTRAVRPRNSVLDSSKFTRDFGFTMPDWRLSVGDVIRRLAEGPG